MPFSAFEILHHDDTPLVFLCDHASNHVPECTGGGSLGLSEADMARHIAYDIGAKGVTEKLVTSMGGAAVFSNFSRLVIDPNRAEDDPTLLMRLYDGTLIPANRHADEREKERRLDAFHRPYHNAIRGLLDSFPEDVTPVLVSMHSFTPQLSGRAMRPWHVGILSAEDRRLTDPFLHKLQQIDGLCVGDNEPYVGSLEGDCMAQHGLARGLPHVLIELRNDLIENAKDQTEWAQTIAAPLQKTIDEFRAKELKNG